MSQKQRVIFVCTHNSARSQMAEGLLRHLAGDRYEVYSAGTVATKVNPLAIKAMAEKGIDISHHTSDHIDKYMGIAFDYVITVCDNAKETCPYFPTNKTRWHWSFEDPAAATGTEEERLARFREIRDQIEQRLQILL
ncbi:MAG: arsenate reductase ArsC [candidate division KSB1 bacterium]|nr:arsenate reductase ArsC [candidate division KSB1 bacterium]MDZ7273317.1 arsenate reductase ArsC [candidate division KSB1 bacterium]MDZ7285421.1 arsenate reductase ArsC [candidate division KSB1 bacterium]MDZ7298452.1 arsenate reductase ArsC [candidate division KSB1 bacterium]MDZ7348915.1 arsenate reductase ArsC [candidate division KSB1 bacterium]